MRYINQPRRSDQTPTRGLTLSKAKSFLVKTTKFFLSFDRVRPRKQKSEKVASTGDTIIEVMMSLVILSLILATVYAMGTRSLRAGTESNQRTEALSIAQSQIDLLVNAKNIDPSFAQNFQTDQAYCLKPDGTKDTSAQNNSNKLCNSYSGGQYSVGVSYDSNVFTITTQWPSADAPNGMANLNLYYKLPGVYKKAFVTAGSATTAGTSATINGTVNPNGNLVTDCYFNYDTSLTYSHAKKAACSSLPGSGTSDVAVSANISGLDTDSVYYFQLCATNIVGTACSVNNGTFTTPAKPTITNQSASDYLTASGNTANLNAQINPNGSTVTECHFEWGLTVAYGSSKSCGGVIGSGTALVPVTVNISPLVAGSTYHFRAVATNAAGTKQGSDSTFVPEKVVPPTVSLTASPSSIGYNSSSTLSWSSTKADNCIGNGFSTGAGSPKNGSASTGNLTTTTSYTVTCTGSGGSTTSSPSTVVTVAPPPLPPPPPPPPPSPLAWLCGNFWGEWKCVGPFGPGDYGWVESYGIQNDRLGWVLVQNTTLALYAGIYFNTYDGATFCATLSSSSSTPESMWTWGIGGTSSFRVGRGC